MATINTSTIQPSGGDYSTVSGWEAGEQRDLTAGGEVEKGVISGFASPLDDTVEIAGWTTSSDNFVWLTVADSDRHNGTPGSGFKMESSANFGLIIDIQQRYTIVERIEAENTGTTNGDTIGLGDENIIVRDMIVKSVDRHGFTFPNAPSSDATNGPIIINNLIYDCGGNGLNVVNQFVGLRFFNNTVTGCVGFGIGNASSNAGRRRYVNNVAYNNGTNYENPTVDESDDTDNASDDGTASSIIGGTNGSGVVTGVVAGDFEDPANDDFRLASGSALIDQGADLTTAFGAEDRTDYTNEETDVVGTTRSTWDIGFFEFEATAGGRTGDISAQSQNATASISGEVSISGDIVAQSQNATTNISADVEISGDINAQSQNSTVSIDGDIEISGDINAQSQNATATINGEVPVSGDISAQAENSTTTISADVEIQGDITAQSQDATATLSSSSNVTGDINIQSQNATASISGDVEIQGDINAQSQDATASISTSNEVSGDINAQSQNATASIDGDVEISGLIGAQSQPANFNGQADVEIDGGINAQAGNASVSIDGEVKTNNITGNINAQAGDSTVSSIGNVLIQGNGSFQAQNATVTITGQYEALFVKGNTVAATKFLSPSNTNFLSPLGFRLSLNKTPILNYFCNSVELPDLSMNEINVSNPFGQKPYPGDKIDFTPLTVTFMVDEDMKNYFEIFDWITGLGFPDNFEQYRNELGVSKGQLAENKNTTLDGTLTILTSNHVPNINIFFEDLFPVSLSGLDFNTKNTDVEYLQSTVSFAYRKFDIENVA